MLNKNITRKRVAITILNNLDFVCTILLVIAFGLFFTSVIITQFMKNSASTLDATSSSIANIKNAIPSSIDSSNINSTIASAQSSINDVNQVRLSIIHTFALVFEYATLSIVIILLVKGVFAFINYFLKIWAIFKVRLRFKLFVLLSIILDTVKIIVLCLFLVMFLSIGYFAKYNLLSGNAYTNEFFSVINQIMTSNSTNLPSIPIFNYTLILGLWFTLFIIDILNYVIKWISLRKKCFKALNNSMIKKQNLQPTKV